MSTSLANSEWKAFINKLGTAEEEFVQGRPAAFLALWSHSDDVTLCGGFGGVETWMAERNKSPRLGQRKIYTGSSQQGRNKQLRWDRVCLSCTN
jgi:hypothetical protein